jgi:hypothetical protein
VDGGARPDLEHATGIEVWSSASWRTRAVSWLDAVLDDSYLGRV